MKRIVLILTLIFSAQIGFANGVSGTFQSIDGGTLSVEAWRGQPVLVVNTASQCAFTGQYSALQKLHDRYRTQGLVVLAVPSDDFRQELESAEEVKEFCELNFDLDLPMTDITHVKGAQTHAFFKAVKAKTGFEPNWNFNKILIGPDGEIVATWGSVVNPLSRKVIREIEAVLK